MLQAVSQKFRSGCMMLARGHAGALDFLGSAFLVHAQGYLLTAAHLVSDPEGLTVVPTVFTDDFAPVTFERVAAMPVSVARRDNDHDVALLRIEQDIGIAVPDDFLGGTGAVRPGASVMSLGYSFGHQQLHSLMVYGAVVSAKVRSHNGSKLILFDSMTQEGDRGGPLVHVADSHIVGIVSGRYEPEEVARAGTDWARAGPRDINVSYAVAIEYGVALMRDEGLIPEPLGI